LQGSLAFIESQNISDVMPPGISYIDHLPRRWLSFGLVIGHHYCKVIEVFAGIVIVRIYNKYCVGLIVRSGWIQFICRKHLVSLGCVQGL